MKLIKALKKSYRRGGSVDVPEHVGDGAGVELVSRRRERSRMHL